MSIFTYSIDRIGIDPVAGYLVTRDRDRNYYLYEISISARSEREIEHQYKPDRSRDL